MALADWEDIRSTGEACLDVQAVKLDEVAGVEKVAVIYPIILPDRLEVIINLPGQQLRHKSTKITSEEVEALVERLRGALYNRISLEFRPLSQQVYDLLIRPIEQDLGQSQICSPSQANHRGLEIRQERCCSRRSTRTNCIGCSAAA